METTIASHEEERLATGHPDQGVRAEADPLMRAIRSFEAARAALGMPGVSWAADLTRLDALVRRYPAQARSILRRLEARPDENDRAR